METRRYVRCLAGAFAMLALATAARADQCPGTITALANDDAGTELAVILAPEQDCGCQGNRFVVPGDAPGRKAMHADLLAAMLTGTRVSLGYSHDPATAPWCRIHNASLMR